MKAKQKKPAERTALIGLVLFLLVVGIASFLIFQKNQSTQDALDLSDSASQDVNGVRIDKTVTSTINNFNNLPAQGRSVVYTDASTFIKTCSDKAKNDPQAKLSISVETSNSTSALVSYSCHTSSNTLYNQVGNSWKQVWTGSGDVPCTTVNKYKVSSVVATQCVGADGATTANTNK